MLKPIIILVAIGAIGLVGYKVFAQKDEPTQINETVLLINDANKSVEEADHTIEKANASFQKIPLNEYKPDNSTFQASQLLNLNFRTGLRSKKFRIESFKWMSYLKEFHRYQ